MVESLVYCGSKCCYVITVGYIVEAFTATLCSPFDLSRLGSPQGMVIRTVLWLRFYASLGSALTTEHRCPESGELVGRLGFETGSLAWNTRDNSLLYPRLYHWKEGRKEEFIFVCNVEMLDEYQRFSLHATPICLVEKPWIPVFYVSLWSDSTGD